MFNYMEEIDEEKRKLLKEPKVFHKLTTKEKLSMDKKGFICITVIWCISLATVVCCLWGIFVTHDDLFLTVITLPVFLLVGTSIYYFSTTVRKFKQVFSVKGYISQIAETGAVHVVYWDFFTGEFRSKLLLECVDNVKDGEIVDILVRTYNEEEMRFVEIKSLK